MPDRPDSPRQRLLDSLTVERFDLTVDAGLVDALEWATGLNGTTLLHQLREQGLTVTWAKGTP